ncbi:L-glutamate gamma-semialdehyde dehydrogenase [Desulfohalobium retbaense]|uniref:L-glutamate gamma-semialdehyde dehydrogenase n=1 Tax=Desulfohalobium retbaense (strain ATCC 49708 / DSM 5692 / JCM 16813 / HR100) TaxID=485915 RepID=C8X4M0_DESRD|nr:L-glutamate gamma-semialdehyde dehydrogenase [Desulfohalobium retbaense]ACV69243.1 delta-1-pyrroline-5-carboxylate dehydrogenase [Desulfohalobium retbaense DSM 5692]
MDMQTLNPKIKARGREFFQSISGEAPTVFNKGWWTGKVMDWAMRNEQFKIQLFRFVDVLPYLNTTESLNRHIQEYFVAEDQEIPAVLKWGAKGAGMGKGLAGKVMTKTIRSNIEGMAKQFIIGENTKQAIKNLNKLRKDGFAFTVDILGEATVSEEEGVEYQTNYLHLMDALAQEAKSWKGLGGNSGDWGHAPLTNISIKPSALYSQARPSDFENTVQAIFDRLMPVLDKAMAMGCHVCIDMEQYKYKDITLEVFKRLRSHEKFREYPHIAIVLQSYLLDTDQDLDALLHWARTEHLPISIRLVKGAYWDYETVLAKQHGWDIPVYINKHETDAAFERQTATILRNSDICHYACGSHNIRSIAAAQEMAEELGVPEEQYEFQVLYGMAEPVRKGLRNVAKRVRLYCPYGELIPGMAYLVRRLLENTANESFLKQSFADHEDVDHLLEDPALLAQSGPLSREKTPAPPPLSPSEPFRNEPAPDFTKESERVAYPEALAEVRRQLGRTYPLYINGQEVTTEDLLPSLNPADPGEVVGSVCQASTREIDEAIAAANEALPAWRDLAPEDRAQYIFRAADIARKNIHTLSAWQILEVGKQWNQAHGDVAEAIDFMEYYARDMIRLGRPRRTGKAPGELTHYFYQSKGIAAVIGPWNFPLAISCGMSAASLVTGNCVLYKPAGLSSVVGHTLCQIFRDAGLPPGVFNFVPGRGSVIGDYLVDHPDIALVAFTGSLDVGLRIIERAARLQPGQEHVKKVIAEMGGKNAIIVDDDADLDEAVADIIYSAFGYQGQKCSACSRVIVLDSIYDKFMHRLTKAAQSLPIGPAEDPGNFMGPVVDKGQQDKVNAAVALAEEEGNVVLKRDDHPDTGSYAPLTIVENITPEHRLAQEEIFGPVLAVMRVKDFDQALQWANSTPYALTGAVFSRSPQHLDRARTEFRVGNLYLNRGSTGSMVERHPFGGFKLSGVGSKTGGPDYLLQFMDPRTATENTMRRGFAPIIEGDDWLD